MRHVAITTAICSLIGTSVFGGTALLATSPELKDLSISGAVIGAVAGLVAGVVSELVH